MKKIKLKSTATLVMHWSQELYQQKPLDRYMKYLDLNEGEYLIKRCDDICDWYKEVILNRKMLIYDNVILNLISNKEPSQIVIIAAGMCPLSLKILQNYENRVSHIFEVDQSYMEQKTSIYNEFYPEHSDNVSCISCDITKPNILKHLKTQENFDFEKPQIVITEGISYYISPFELKKLIKIFASQERKNKFIMDYLIPFNEVDIDRRKIPRDIFETIQDHCDISTITSYSRKDIEKLFNENKWNLQEIYTLNNMEFQRKGKYKYFHTPSDGWIQIVNGNI